MINESPDTIIYNKNQIDWNDEISVPFSYHDNKLYIGRYNSTHANIMGRSNTECNGRLFLKSKIITFWVFPKKNELKRILLDIQQKYNYDIINSLNTRSPLRKIKFDNTWKIEIVVDKKTNLRYDPKLKEKDWSNDNKKLKYIPINQYYNSDSHSETEMNKQHIISPLLKQKREVPYGAGSRKRVPGAIKGEPPVITRFRMRKGLGDSIINNNKNIIFEHINRIRKKIHKLSF